MIEVKVSNSMSGLAKVQVHPTEPKVRVTIKPVNAKGEEGEPQTFVLNKEDCPEYVRSGLFLVNLAGNGKKMYSCRPSQGVFKLKVKEFTAKKDEQPAPKTNEGKFGPYLTFGVNFEITEGENKGMIVPGRFPYDFQEGKEDVPGKGMVSVVAVKVKEKSRYNDQLRDFLKVTGMKKQTLPWKENVLPILQKYILKEEKVFQGSVKNGWIDSLFSEDQF